MPLSTITQERLDKVRDDLRAMYDVRDNWDSYGAAAPQPQAVTFAVGLAELLAVQLDRQGQEWRMFVSPTRVGGVMIGIEAPPLEVEVEIEPDLSLGILRTDLRTGATEEREYFPDARRNGSGFAATLELLVA